ncbi:MAG: PorT family protein [Bacteroidia bacterium]|nr:PorT family protein [Bacteroidia bacterium]
MKIALKNLPSDLHFRPELGISQSGAVLEDRLEITPPTEAPADLKLRLTTLDIPILLGERIGVGNFGLRAVLGPVFSYVLKARLIEERADTQTMSNIRSQTNLLRVALQFGFGVDISRFRVDVRYQNGFTNLYEDTGAETFSIIQATLGYQLY